MLFITFAISLLGLAAAQDFDLTLISTSGQSGPSTATESLVSRCVTQSGPTSRAVLAFRTNTQSLETSITSNMTYTPTVTFTPSLQINTTTVNVTLTNTETQSQSTSIATITDVQSVTAVFTMVATDISTSLVAETVTSTTSAIIPPSSGFVPIQSVIALAGGVPGKRDRINARARAKRPAAQMVVNDNGDLVVEPRQYPVRVQCLEAIFVTVTRFITIVADTKTVTADTPFTEITVTATILANATELQAGATQLITETAVVTCSSTTTVEQSTTIMSTTTTTLYETYPTPYYAACGPDNLARSVDGIAIGVMGVKNTFGTLNAITPYDCCVRGIQGSMAGTFFKNGACYLVSQAAVTVCDASEQAFTFTTKDTLDAADAIVVSNGNCGQGQYVEPPVSPAGL